MVQEKAHDMTESGHDMTVDKYGMASLIKMYWLKHGRRCETHQTEDEK